MFQSSFKMTYFMTTPTSEGTTEKETVRDGTKFTRIVEEFGPDGKVTKRTVDSNKGSEPMTTEEIDKVKNDMDVMHAEMQAESDQMFKDMDTIFGTLGDRMKRMGDRMRRMFS